MLKHHSDAILTSHLRQTRPVRRGYGQGARFLLANLKFSRVLVVLMTISLHIAVPTLSSGQSYIFNRADYAAGIGATAIGLGDLNKDGRTDVVVGNGPGSNSVSVLLGKPDGTFGPPVQYPLMGTIIDLAIADLNSDGNLDVAVVGVSEGVAAINILLGNGNGTFQPSVSFGAGASPTGIAVGDLNSDGTPDLAVADNAPSVNGVSFCLARVTGPFRYQLFLPRQLIQEELS